MGEPVYATSSRVLLSGVLGVWVLSDGRAVVSREGAIRAVCDDQSAQEVRARFEAAPSVRFTANDRSEEGLEAGEFVRVCSELAELAYSAEPDAKLVPTARRAADVLAAFSSGAATLPGGSELS